MEVEVNSKRGSPGHDVSDLVLETVEESRALGEDIVLVGLRELTGEPEELLALEVSVVEQQAEELCIDTSRGGEGGWHEGYSHNPTGTSQLFPWPPPGGVC